MRRCGQGNAHKQQQSNKKAAAGGGFQLFRVVPRFNDTPEIREYYEFMEYYPFVRAVPAAFYFLRRRAALPACRKRWAKRRMKSGPQTIRREVVSLMNWITKAYNAHGGDKMRTTPADVMLLLLRLYKLDELKTYSPAQFAAAIDAVWDNVLALERRNRSSSAPSRPPRPKRTAC